MNRFLIACAVLFALVSPVVADQTFEFEGKQWTVIGNHPPIAANYMFPGSARACPTLKVRFESVTPSASNGGKMSKEARNRGDKRWHVVCVYPQ